MSFLLDNNVTMVEMGLLTKEVNRLIFKVMEANVNLGNNVFAPEDQLIKVLSKNITDNDQIHVTMDVPIGLSAIATALDLIRKGDNSVLHIKE